MKKIVIFLLFPFIIFSQSSYNLSLVGSYNWSSSSYDSEGSDIWGWKNPATGVEYALVGLNSGFSVVDLSSPQNPFEVFFIPGVNKSKIAFGFTLGQFFAFGAFLAMWPLVWIVGISRMLGFKVI